MLARPKTRGFYHAPVTKGLLVLNGSASLLNILLASSSIKRLIPSYEWIEVIRHLKILHALSSTIYFSYVRDLLCGSFLLYTFRIFERRYGSRKFASFIFASTVITVGLQLFAVYGVKHLGHDVGPLPSGLYGIIFSSLVQYFFDIPTVDAVTVVGIPISGKVLCYSVALQMLLGSKESLIAGTCGMIAGFIYKSNAGYVQSWLKLPRFVTNIFSRTIGWMFISNDEVSPTPIMGATVEIQEQQQMEWYEQQMWRRAAAASTGHPRTRSRAGQGYAEVMVPQAGGLREWLMGAGNMHDGPNHWQAMMNHNDGGDLPQQPTVEVSEDQVQTLVDMGFSRQDVLHALSVTNNDVNNATSVLLSNSS